MLTPACQQHELQPKQPACATHLVNIRVFTVRMTLSTTSTATAATIKKRAYLYSFAGFGALTANRGGELHRFGCRFQRRGREVDSRAMRSGLTLHDCCLQRLAAAVPSLTVPHCSCVRSPCHASQVQTLQLGEQQLKIGSFDVSCMPLLTNPPGSYHVRIVRLPKSIAPCLQYHRQHSAKACITSVSTPGHKHLAHR